MTSEVAAVVPTASGSPLRAIAWLTCVLLLLTGCGNMKKQRYARDDTPVAQLPQGTSAHAPPAHTVPHRSMSAAEATFTTVGLATMAKPPMPVTRELLERGHERFAIYCAVCHGEDGYGHGIVVRRGFPAPPSFHDQRLRDVPVGYIVSVIVNGHGLMYPYADRIEPGDRWAIAAYVRALQFSQHAPVSQLSQADRQHLDQL